jgi:hypothetical protein
VSKQEDRPLIKVLQFLIRRSEYLMRQLLKGFLVLYTAKCRSVRDNVLPVSATAQYGATAQRRLAGESGRNLEKGT